MLFDPSMQKQSFRKLPPLKVTSPQSCLSLCMIEEAVAATSPHHEVASFQAHVTPLLLDIQPKTDENDAEDHLSNN